MGFIKKGYDEFDKKEEQVEEQKKNQIYRFWLPPEAETNIIFLDNEPSIIEEHQLKIGGSWKNWFTCLSLVDEACPICASGDNPSIVGYYTIIDRSEWKDGRGNQHKDEIKLFPAKMSTMKKLKRANRKLKEQGHKDGLTGVEFNVFRSSGDAPNTGDDFTVKKVHTKEEILAINADARTADYETILAPKPRDEVQSIVGNNDAKQSFESEEDLKF